MAKGRKTGGRQKGTPNKTTRAVREFLAELCDDAKVQQAVRRRVIKQDSPSFFRALDKIVPDAPKQVEVSGTMEWVLSLPNGDDVAETD
jgi:hypothetical protein